MGATENKALSLTTDGILKQGNYPRRHAYGLTLEHVRVHKRDVQVPCFLRFSRARGNFAGMPNSHFFAGWTDICLGVDVQTQTEGI